jgi:hypothetical protein
MLLPIHSTSPTPPVAHLEAYKRTIRSEICARCERRDPPLGVKVDPSRELKCEHDCGIFIHLPALVNVARLRDPMLLDSAAAKAACERPAPPGASALQKHGGKAVNIMARMARY